MGENKINIRNQLLIAMSFFTLIGLLIAITSMYFINKIHDIYKVSDVMQSLYKNYSLAVSSEQYFLKSETRKTYFYETGESDYVDELKNNLSTIIRELDNLKEQNTYDKFEIREDLYYLTGEITQYQTTFETIVEKFKEKGFKDYGLEGKLKNYISELESKSRNISSESVLMLRKHEKDYLLTSDPVHISKLSNKIIAIKNLVWDRNSIKYSDKDSINILLNKYQKSFQEFVSVTNEIGYENDKGLNELLNIYKNTIESRFASIQHKTFTQSNILVNNLKVGFILVVINIIAISVFIVILYTLPGKKTGVQTSALPVPPIQRRRAPKVIVTQRRIRSAEPVR